MHVKEEPPIEKKTVLTGNVNTRTHTGTLRQCPKHVYRGGEGIAHTHTQYTRWGKKTDTEKSQYPIQTQREKKKLDTA
jgi:hypothetical protein